MQTQVEKLEGGTAVLAVSLTPDEVERGMDRAYRRLVQRVNIPGFRRGKAPRGMLERHVGRAKLLEEAVEILIPEGYQAAVDEAHLEPVDRPHIDITEHPEEANALKFKVTVTVKPEVELGEYRSARDGVPREEPEVTPAQVDEQVEALRERLARLESVEGGAVEKGSFAICDIKIVRDGEAGEKSGAGKKAAADKAAADKGDGEGTTVEVGSGTLLPGIEDALIGAHAGDVRDIEVDFPADHRNRGVAGRRLPVRATVREVKRKVLPPLDDELAKQSGGPQTLQELKSDLANRLLRLAGAKSRREYEDRVVQAVADQARLEVPGVMAERYIEALWQETLQALKARGVTVEQYTATRGKPESELREEMRPRAEAAVRRELVLEAVARREGLEATPADLEREAKRLAAVYRQPLDVINKALLGSSDLDATRDNITHRKTIAFLAHGTADEAWPPVDEAEPSSATRDDADAGATTDAGAAAGAGAATDAGAVAAGAAADAGAGEEGAGKEGAGDDSQGGNSR
jgi:trigger factor